jgi:hypothetical protein
MIELPPPNTGRWVASRKALVVAVSCGMITIEDACHRYRMSEAEFFAWQHAFENNGIVGLWVGYVRQNGTAFAPPDRPPRQPSADAGSSLPGRVEKVQRFGTGQVLA